MPREGDVFRLPWTSMFTRAAGIRSLLRVCTLRPHLSLSLLHARTHSSSLFLSLQTPLTTASRLLSSFFYSLVNAPFVNRPRVGFRKIPIANRLGSLDCIWLEFDWQADDLTPFFWFFNSYSFLFFRIVI